MAGALIRPASIRPCDECRLFSPYDRDRRALFGGPRAHSIIRNYAGASARGAKFKQIV
jgi:hypothetical protein